MKKKISIIIPSYNAGEYILENLRVLCKEKYKDSIEVIIVDDGSKDNTRNVVNSYIKNCSFVKYLYQENSGAPAARNNGFNHSTGEYVIFLDADDVIIEKSLDKIIKLVNKNDYDLIVGNFEQINQDGKYLNSVIEYKNDEFVEGEKLYNIIAADPKPGSKVYNSSIIKKYNIVFDDLKIGQDLNFYVKYMIFAKNVYSITNSIYQYRIVSGSISRTYTLKILKIKDSFDAIKNFYLENNKIDIYNKYVEIVKALRYYSQFCKIRFIQNKENRLIAYDFFKKEYKKLNIDKSSKLYISKKKDLLKFKIRILMGRIYTTNLYCYLYRKIKGNYHNC